jgi:gliding motility-associated-like protein
VDLTIERDFTDTLCLYNSNDFIDFDGFENSGVQGSGEFSGTGITDPLEGTFDMNLAGPGMHSIFYTFTFNNDLCENTIQDVIYIIEEPTYDLSINTNQLCIGDTLELEINGLSENDTFITTLDGATIITDNGAGGYELTWDTEGMKTIDVTIENGYCGQYIQQISLETQALPPINLNCGQSTSFSISFAWDNVSIYENYQIFIDGNLVDNITGNSFEATNLASNTGFDIEVVPIFSAAVCPIISESIVCSTNNCVPVDAEIINNSSNIICGQPPFNSISLALDYDSNLFDGSETIEWIGPNVDGLGNFDPNALGSGQFDVISVLNYFDCKYFDTLSFTIDIPPTLSLTAASEVCIEDDWLLEYIGDPLGSYDFSWSGLPSTANLGSIGPHQFSFDSPGIHSIILEAMSDNCDAIPVEFSVLVLDSTRTPEVSCLAESDFIEVQWTVEDSGCNGSYTILLNGTTMSSDQNDAVFTFDNLEPDTEYNIEIINNSSCNCTSKSIAFTCKTNNCPAEELEISAPSLSFCLDGDQPEIQLIALLNGTEITDNLSWNGDGIDSEGVIQLDDSFTPGQQTYDLSFQNGLCPYYSSITIDLFSPVFPEYNIEDPNCPESLSGLLIFQNPDPAHTYYLDGVPIDPTSPQEVELGNHLISLESDNVCMSATEFDILPATEFDFLINGPEVLQLGETGNYSIQSDLSVSIDSIVWDYLNLHVNDPNPEISLELSSKLCANIYYNDGCFLQICSEVRVLGANIYIPNVISKHPDSPNGNFLVFSNDQSTMVTSIQIYDRWGTLLFEKEDKELTDTDLQWDGTFRDKIVPVGVYVYVVDLLFSNGEERQIIGDITVLH